VVPVDIGCTDRGGSNLVGCTATGASGRLLAPSSPGGHVLTITAADGAGNTTTVTRSYTVVPTLVPDLMQRKPGHPVRWKDSPITSKVKRGGVAVTRLRLRNEGNIADRFTLKGTSGGPSFEVRYYAGGKDVTARVVAGTYRTRALAPSQDAFFRVVVIRLPRANPGRTKSVKVTARSGGTRDRRTSC
jgi:hypothetical protein